MTEQTERAIATGRHNGGVNLHRKHQILAALDALEPRHPTGVPLDALERRTGLDGEGLRALLWRYERRGWVRLTDGGGWLLVRETGL
jgi:DNA-binding IclR family transcriptional regulator